MNLYLASDNPGIREVVRDVLAELESSTLQYGSAGAPAPAADLYLWDIEPDARVVAEALNEQAWRHFFLVGRADVCRLRDSVPFKDANILIKPVTRAALFAFLTNAVEQVTRQRTRTAESLRADRDTILQCLLQANLKLQEYDHDRTNFLARAIHDFRAPLTAITGYCGLLLGEDVGALTEEQREVIDRMHRSAKKLSRMASAMFHLSTAPRAEPVLDMKSGKLNECLDQALHEILPTAQEKRLLINADLAPCPELLCFDRLKIEQVLVNLLDNACKFAPRMGTIDIKGYPYHWDCDFSLECADGGLGRSRRNEMFNSYRLDIRDTGPGIPATHLTKIFEEYTSYGGGADRSGGGLGLAICRMILTQHKGRIWAETSSHGALFSFVLPYYDGARVSEQHDHLRASSARAF